MNPTNKPKQAVLVTGGAKRIGQAICLELAAKGYAIALHYNRSKKNAQTTQALIKKLGGTCRIFPCDLSQEKPTIRLIHDVKKFFPQLNILVNNASLFEKSDLVRSSLGSLNKHMNVNFKAPFILSREFAKVCKKGAIVNMLDTHINKNQTDYFDYLLSKKALAELTRLSAVRLAPSIRVNAIAPGIVLKPENKSSRYAQRLAKSIPLRKKGELTQIGLSVQFLIDNPFITGQTIFNDGGEHLL